MAFSHASILGKVDDIATIKEAIRKTSQDGTTTAIKQKLLLLDFDGNTGDKSDIRIPILEGQVLKVDKLRIICTVTSVLQNRSIAKPLTGPNINLLSKQGS